MRRVNSGSTRSGFHLVIVLLNGLIGFVQSWRADRALAALRQLAAAKATVLRDGHVRVVLAN